MNKKILITGGAGYIGSHTCKTLALNGFTPITYDNLSTGNRWAVKWGPFVEGDILDTQFLRKAIIEYTPEAVIHFAAKAYVADSFDLPVEYYTTNVAGTLSLIRALRGTTVKTIIFSSSCAVYGTPTQLPVSESHAINPISPYGKTKAAAEEIIKDCAKKENFNYSILRYFNAAGADPDCDIGEHHQPETHLIPIALSAALNQTDQLTINGVNHRTPDGTCVRDFVHVMELAEAHFQAMKISLGSENNSIINLGSGNGASINDIITKVQQVTGRTVTTAVGPARVGDPPILLANTALAKDILNWKARASIDTIVRDAFKWENAKTATIG